MIMTGTINAHSLSDFPSMIASCGRISQEKSQQKYPIMASTLTVNMSKPRLLSRIDASSLEGLRHTPLKTFESPTVKAHVSHVFYVSFAEPIPEKSYVKKHGCIDRTRYA
jgi:hypothetical protein